MFEFQPSSRPLITKASLLLNGSDLLTKSTVVGRPGEETPGNFCLGDQAMARNFEDNNVVRT